MSMINIPSHIKDPNYRYTMPKLVCTVQGGGKTRMDNIIDVAKALNVPPDYPLKFIGRELGSQVDIKNDTYLINGSLQADKLQQLLDKFIEKYVLCPKCKLPEIRIFIKKGEIRCTCRACGTVSKLDEKHKFSQHIKNFPPKYEDADKSLIPDIDKKVKSKEETVKKKPTISKEVKEKIKNTMEKITKIVSYSNENQNQIINIEKVFEEMKFENDIKVFSLLYGLFDKNIYANIKNRSGVLKHFIKTEENMFHLCSTLADFLIFKFSDLVRYIPSILYLLYEEEVITEEFWFKYAIKQNLQHYENIFLDRDTEVKFIEAAYDFTHWIENAPYEDEEGEYSRNRSNQTKKEEKIENKVDSKADIETKTEEINIDEI